MNLQKGLYAIAVAAFVVSSIGCKGKSASEIVSNIKNKANEKKNELAIAGTWVSNCESESIIPKFKTGREVYKFKANGNFEKYHYFFSDDKCTSPSVVRIEKGEVKFPETVDIKDKDGAPVDFSFKKVELETKSKTVVDALNAVGYCDRSFSVGQKTDLTEVSQQGLNCAGIKHVPRNTFDTMKLSGSQLMIAGDASEEDVQDRPSVADHATVFTKGDYRAPND